MNILLLNSVLYTAQDNVIPQVESIKDCMIYNLALGFKELGHNVTLLAAADYRPVKEEEYDIPVLFIESVCKRLFLPSVLPFQPGLWNYLRRERGKYDLVVSSEVFAFPSLFAAILCPKKTVIWHELAVHTKKMHSIPSYCWYHIVAKLFFRKTWVIARSENAKRFISKYVAHVSDRVVEHGINLTKFQFSREKKEQFIVVSQLIPRKNIDSILAKFHCLVAKKEFRHFRLVIAGRGELENSLKRLTVELGIDGNVDFAGFKTHHELNRLMAESMAMLIDTKQDNNMVSIPEAVVSGTPVVTNLVPTNACTIDRHQLGIALNGWDENTLIDIIRNNAFYVDHCIAYREKLSNTYSAQELINK
ncbi:MAG: glycosyltransferase [Tannerellaceae bacterium]|jgi:1,2-diacylglycerol 3-alpha-glucosyltransferase|nr:glycosyltransferase [Tannerellaceae bacterium]